jgi:DNA-binding CsgD family transcriptional regulator
MRRSDAQYIANIIEAEGAEAFGAAMDDFIANQAQFDVSSIFAFSFDRRPLLLYDGYTSQVSKSALEAYLSGGYLLDPFYVACCHDHPTGVWRMGDLAPDSFFTSEFSMSADVHPCVSTDAGALIEEIGFLVPLEPGLVATYSVMRTHNRETFTESEFERLKAIEPLVAAVIQANWRQRRGQFEGRKPATQTSERDSDEAMESAFSTLFVDELTLTQRAIVKMILRGHSNLSIAMRMNISEGTVKIHRANIYKRLSISSQGELFRLFIKHLNNMPAL